MATIHNGKSYDSFNKMQIGKKILSSKNNGDQLDDLFASSVSVKNIGELSLNKQNQKEKHLYLIIKGVAG